MPPQQSPRIDSYLALASRIQSIMRSPASQIAHRAVIKRTAGDSDQDWMRAIDELSSDGDLVVDQQPDDRIVVSWAIRRR